MATTIVTKTSAFTIADADIGAGDDSVTYRCTGNFAVTIPATGPTAEKVFVIQSTDGLQSFTTAGATVSIPQDKELEPYGTNATIIIVCHSTGSYDVSGDLVAAPLASLSNDEVSFSAGRVFPDFAPGVAGTATVIWDDVHSNLGNGYDSTTGKFTAPVDGTYHFDYTFRLDNHNNGGFYHEIIGVSSRNQQYETSLSPSYQPYTGGLISYLAEGTEVYINIISNTDTDHHLEYRSMNFSGYLISPAVVIAPNGIEHSFAVNASTTTQVNIPDGAWATVEFTTAEKEHNVSFDLTGNVFVAPSDGTYNFSTSISVENIPLVANIAFYSGLGINGTTKRQFERQYSDGTNTNVRLVGSADLELVAGDEVDARVYHTDTTEVVDIQASASNTWFSGHKVSGTSTGVEYDSYDIAFGVSLSADQTLASVDTNIPLEMNSIKYDNGGNFDTTNYEFIAPVAGIYQFNSSLRIEEFDYTNVSAYTNFKISTDSTIVNPAIYLRISPDELYTTGVRFDGISLSGSLKLNAGDVVWVDANQHIVNTVKFRSTSSFSGHLVKSITKAECSFNANRGGTNQTLTVSGWSKINLTNTEFDYGNNVDTVTNNRFNVPEDGRYVFSYAVSCTTLTNSTTRVYIGIRKNGTDYLAQGTGGPITSLTQSVASTILDLVAGDYIELMFYQNESTSETVSGVTSNTYLAGYRLVSSQDTPKVTNDLSDVSYRQAVTNDVLLHDGTEYVPTQILNDEVSFRAYATVAQTITDALDTLVEFDTVDHNVGNAYLTSTDRFVAPIDGVYSFKAGVSISSLGDTDWTQIHLIVDGTTTIARGSRDAISTTTTNTARSVVSIDVELTKDQYVQVMTRQESGGSLDTGGNESNVYFSGHLTSPAVVIAPNGITQGFRVHKDGTDQTLTINGYNGITWSASDYLQNVGFDFTNNKFVVPSTGQWAFSATGRIASFTSSSNAFIALSINGERTAHGTRPGTAVTSGFAMASTVTDTYYLEAGDEVTVDFYQNESTSETLDGLSIYTYFSGHKVSGTSTGVEYDSYDVSFRVGIASQYTQTAGSGFPHTAKLDTIDFDNGGNFDTTNYKFIAPVDGTYHFDAMHHAISVIDQERVLVKIQVNNVNRSLDESSVSTSGNSNVVCSVGDTYNLVAGDEVDLELQIPGEAAIRDTGSLTYLSGYLVEGSTKAECSFYAHRNEVNDTLTTSGDNWINFTHTEYNNGNNYDITTNKFTAPEDGRYLFSYSVTVSTLSDGAELYARMKRNGVDIWNGSRSTMGSAATGTSTNTVILDLVKGDYLEVGAYQTDSTSETLIGNSKATYFSGYRLVTSPTASLTEEVGTWEATLTSGASTTPTSTTDGEYVKIGSMVTVSLNTDFGSLTPAANAVKISGLPFTARTGGIYTGSLGHLARAQYVSGNHHYCEVLGNTTEVVFKAMAPNAGSSTALLGENGGGPYTPVYRFSLTYFTDE